MDKIIAETRKNAYDTLLITLQKYEGRHYLDLRSYTLPIPPSTERTPTRKGISVRIDDLHFLKSAIAAAEKIILENKLI